MIVLSMVSLPILAAIAIVVLLAAAILAPRIKSWIASRRLRKDGGSLPVYKCSLVSKGSGTGSANREDIYDCIEAGRASGNEKPK